MKRSKIILAAVAIIATAGSAFAVKTNFFLSGSVYCSTTCLSNRVDFRVNPSGAIFALTVCPTGSPSTPHVLACGSGNTITCVGVCLGCRFTTTAAGR